MTIPQDPATAGPDCPTWESALAASIDDPVDAGTARRLDAHLAVCPHCRKLTDDLHQIRQLASTLEPLDPPAEIWERLAATTGRRRLDAVLRPPGSWLAGGAALAAAAMVVLAFRAPASLEPDTTQLAAVTADRGATTSDTIERPYADTIRTLERLLPPGGPDDGAVADALGQGMTTVEQAIADTRSALARDPDSLVAQARLRAGLQHKVALLQVAATIPTRPGGRSRR